MAQKTKFYLPKYTVLEEFDCQVSLKSTIKQDNPGWASNILDVPRVWAKTQGENVKVAILDTGIDKAHHDFQGAVKGLKDFTATRNRKGNGHDKNGHGTHVAGIIGARKNRAGFVGVAPKCDLYIAKVLDDNGSGSNTWVTKAIAWAINQKVDIINMSLGGPFNDPGLYKIMHEALAEGIIIIVAAGNEGSLGVNQIGYPGRYGGVITVGSHDQLGNISGFSSRGGEVDFLAPGSEILSTLPNGRYGVLSGTSMASPFATGLAALVLSGHKKKAPRNRTPIRNCSDMRQHLMLMATHPGYHNNQTGYGPLIPFRYFNNNGVL